MLSRRTRCNLLTVLPLCALSLLTTLPCAAQVYLMVGSDSAGGGIKRFDSTGKLIDTFVSGALLNDGTRGYDFGPDGNLYISSRSDREIRKYDGKTGAFISNFAGNTTSNSSLYRSDVLFGPDGNLYVAGGQDNVVYRSNGVTGADYPLPGNTRAIFASGNGISEAGGLAFGLDGYLYVGSYFGGTILRFDAKTGAFKGTFISGLNHPAYLTFHNGDLYIASEPGNNVSRYHGTTGAFKSVFATTNLSRPDYPLFGPDGNLYVNSLGSNQIIRFNGTTGAFMDVVATITAPDVIRFHDFGPTVSVSGKLTFEGIASMAAARNVAFEFRSLSGTDHVVRLATVPPGGDFSVPGIPKQNYTMHVKGDKYLAANVGTDATGGAVSGVMAFLPAGDADNSNVIDIADFGILNGAFGSDATDPMSDYDIRADFNGNGMVDLADFGLLVNNFGLSGNF